MKWKVAMVNYKNTEPFLYGIKNAKVDLQIDLKLLYPAACSKAFDNNEADIALVPAAFIKNRNDYKIVTNFCIGSDGAVNSVALFSNQPIEQIKKVILDHHSLTSNRLCKILMDNYWNQEVVYTTEDVSNGIVDLEENSAALMIGDKVFEYQSNFKFKYDLGEAWKEMTGLPFVYAVWIAKPNVPQLIINRFNQALDYGVSNIDKLLSETSYNNFDLREYLLLNLEFNFNKTNKMGLDYFLNKYTLSSLMY